MGVLKVSYIGSVAEDGTASYVVILNAVGNPYGQILLGRVFSTKDSAAPWRNELDGERYRYRGDAAKALMVAVADRLVWNGRRKPVTVDV